MHPSLDKESAHCQCIQCGCPHRLLPPFPQNSAPGAFPSFDDCLAFLSINVPVLTHSVPKLMGIEVTLALCHQMCEDELGRGVFRNYYKGHMDKTKGEGGSTGGR